MLKLEKEKLLEMYQKMVKIRKEAVKFAEKSPYPDPQEALDDLFF